MTRKRNSHNRHYLAMNDWLLCANTLRVTLRRASGCRAIVWYPNEHNAVLAGLVAMRNLWRGAGVEALAADLQQAIEDLY